ncbi:hypothetical protein P3T27_007535 [Kitasatospora sp. MAA19]|nr:hypothetical protein [Kitasatospora sp. MAA19]
MPDFARWALEYVAALFLLFNAALIVYGCYLLIRRWPR